MIITAGLRHIFPEKVADSGLFTSVVLCSNKNVRDTNQIKKKKACFSDEEAMCVIAYRTVRICCGIVRFCRRDVKRQLLSHDG